MSVIDIRYILADILRFHAAPRGQDFARMKVLKSVTATLLPRGILITTGVTVICVSPGYVYPRDMCIPIHISLVICTSRVGM